MTPTQRLALQQLLFADDSPDHTLGEAIARYQSDTLTLGQLAPRTVDWRNLVSGPADRGHDHSTVWRNGVLVHDPHPSRAGLLSVNDVIVFVALDARAVHS